MTNQINIDQILSTANANWEVTKLPLYGPQNQPTSGYGIFRSDTDKCIGIVGEKYTPIQNRILLESLQEAAAQNNVSIKRAGILDQGKKVYFQISLPDVQIGKSNTLRYITALNSHDASSNLGFGSTNVVVVCQNTFYQAFRDLERIRHSRNINLKFSNLVEKMRIALTQEDQMIEKLIELSNTEISSKITDDFLLGIIGGSADSTQTKNRLNLVKSANTIEFETHGETAYALFNGITRFTNHMTKYKDVESKKMSLIQGAGSEINKRAYDFITQTYLKEPRILVPVS